MSEVGETTKEVMLTRLDEMEKHAKKYWGILAIFGALLAAGFSTGTYLFITFARASDVAAVHARIGKVNSTVNDVQQDVSALKATTSRIEDDYHWIREQTTEIARSVRARVVAPPTHR